MKFKIGDKVRTHFGNGEIVFYTEGQYLVKIKDFDGHNGGNRYGYDYYDNEDGLNDKWWFIEGQLELVKEED